jgi:CxxC motif-containing protein
MPETRQFTCIVCPRGCSLEVELADGPTVLRVSGQGCKRGEDYARREVVDPRRSLTSTVRTAGLERRRLPVRSAGLIPLGRLVEAARALDGIVVDRPMKCGDLVVKDLIGLGVDIVATDVIGLGAGFRSEGR